MENQPLPFFSKNDRSAAYDSIKALATFVRLAIKEAKKLKADQCRFANTLQIIDERYQHLQSHWSLLELYDRMIPEKSLKHPHSLAKKIIERLENEIITDSLLLNQYKCCLTHDTSITQYERLFLKQEMTELEKNGALLTSKKHHRFNKLKEQLSEDEQKFDDNINDAMDQTFINLSTEQVASIPEKYHPFFEEIFYDHQGFSQRKRSHLEGKGYSLDLSQLCADIVMTHCSSRYLRQKVWKAVNDLAGPYDQFQKYDNLPVMKKIISTRHALANTLGYESFLKLQLDGRALLPEEISQLWEQYMIFIKAETQIMLSDIGLAAQQDRIENLEPWDIDYYQNKILQKDFSVNFDELRRFFPLSKVLSQMLESCSKEFNLLLSQNTTLPTWHPDVVVIAAYNENHEFLGHIYADLLERDFKEECCETVCHTAASLSEPGVVFICCNFERDQGMTFNDIKSLFHEMGHALHHLLTRAPLRALGGLSAVPEDLHELPAHLFEHLFFNKDFLLAVAQDPHTSEQLDETTISRMLHSHKKFDAISNLFQLIVGIFDWQVHKDPDIDPLVVWGQLYSHQSPRILLPFRSDKQEMANTKQRMSTVCCQLTHIFSESCEYAAGYYTYFLADVYSTQVLQRCQEQYSSRTEGLYIFRKAFLECTDKNQCRQRLESFLGGPANISALIRSHEAAIILDYAKEAAQPFLLSIKRPQDCDNDPSDYEADSNNSRKVKNS